MIVESPVLTASIMAFDLPSFPVEWYVTALFWIMLLITYRPCFFIFLFNTGQSFQGIGNVSYTYQLFKASKGSRCDAVISLSLSLSLIGKSPFVSLPVTASTTYIYRDADLVSLAPVTSASTEIIGYAISQHLTIDDVAAKASALVLAKKASKAPTAAIPNGKPTVECLQIFDYVYRCCDKRLRLLNRVGYHLTSLCFC